MSGGKKGYTRDTVEFWGYGYGDHKCSTNGPKNKITMIRVVIIGYAIISCLKYDCCVYNHFATISVGVIIVVIQICWRLGYGTITMTIRIHRKGKQDMNGYDSFIFWDITDPIHPGRIRTINNMMVAMTMIITTTLITIIN